MKRLLCLVVLFAMGITIAEGHVYINDGGSHTINYTIDDYLLIDQDTPGVGTSVSIINGGIVSQSVYAYEDSQVVVSGGEVIRTLTCKGNSSLFFQNGQTGFLSFENNSRGTMSGGIVEKWISLYGDSQVHFLDGLVKRSFDVYSGSGTISGGLIQGQAYAEYGQLIIRGGEIGSGVRVVNTSKAHIFGGTVQQNLEAWGQSELTVSGGHFNGSVFAGWYSGNHSNVMEFDGSNFAINGHTINYGDLASNYGSYGTYQGQPCITGTLTGLLANGDTLDNTFYIFDQADIIFIPEPATVILLSVGVLLLQKRKWFSAVS